MKNLNFIIILSLFGITFSCMNVVLKNVKTNTVKVAKLDVLFDLGDTVIFENTKHEIIRKKLRNGDVVKKEPLVRQGHKETPISSSTTKKP